MLFDQNDQEVGRVTDLFSGFIVRRVGNDVLALYAAPSGVLAGPIDFYHSTADCSDNRYLPIMGGAGFAYFTWPRGGTLFYTKAVDTASTPQLPIKAYEHFEVTDDATHPGVCTPYEAGLASIGVVTTATDPVLASLALPLKVK